MGMKPFYVGALAAVLVGALALLLASVRRPAPVTRLGGFARRRSMPFAP
jgi:hypothetical protein